MGTNLIRTRLIIAIIMRAFSTGYNKGVYNSNYNQDILIDSQEEALEAYSIAFSLYHTLSNKGLNSIIK